jgi:hypothetical protein
MYAPVQKIINFIKKQPPVWRIVSLFLILICLLLAGSYFLLTRTSFLDFFSREEFKAEEPKEIEEPAPIFNLFRLLDGMGVDDEREINPPVFAVQVENMVDARPLSGISKANLVYEAISEAGITRLLAIYTSDNLVPEIGPARSARPYYMDWASEYGALYAHSGGSPEALRAVSDYDILDLNEFANGRFFWRSKSRYMPHNLYTSVELLNEAFAAKDGEVKSFEPWQFKDEVELDGRPSEERRAKIYFSTGSYEVGWQYSRETNDYLRYQADIIQQDKDGSEVRAKNVAVQFVRMITLDSEGRKKVETIGSGEAIVFRDGVKIEGEWSKEKKGERTKFYDSVGQEIKFNPGVTWVEVVPNGTEVEF